MFKPRSTPETETLVANSATVRSTKATTSAVRARSLSSFGHLCVGVWAIGAALLTATQSNVAELLERQIQTLFFELRGPVSPPPDVVILAMDEDTIVQGTQFYASDPKKYSYLEPLQSVPPRRTAYAVAIDRLLKAGAKSVALDVVLDGLGDEADDQALQKVLKQAGDRVTLAAQYVDNLNREGDQTQLLPPNEQFQAARVAIGFINFPVAANGRIHFLASQYPLMVAKTYSPDLASAFLQQSQETPSFAEAALQSARISYSPPRGEDIFFYGPAQTFRHIPFWHVLDPTNWQALLEQGTFKDKIVLIGPTAETYHDFHATPFSKTLLYPNPVTGVEIHANAIATLLNNRSIAAAIPNPLGQAALVVLVVGVTGLVQSRSRRSLHRFGIAMAAALVWAGIGYVVFTQARLKLPVAVPIGAIVLGGISYFATQSASEYLRKLQLQQTLKQYASSPVVREIMNQQEDLQEILVQREQEVFGKRLAGRYYIKRVLGSGGFSETYIAEDTHRPGNPLCVVKRLHPSSNNPKLLQLARTLFQREADTLERLGKHSQIPQLLAYFEEDEEFYLVQEFIPGHPLSEELRIGTALPEVKVIALLRELLTILEYVHGQNVIHRDIKPSNIIRRKSDGQLVLIDFGAVKELQTLAEDGEQTNATIGIGTKGYMPNEQCAGNPRYNSDIYAIGMTAIQALTGLPPSSLKADMLTGEVLWRHRSQASAALADIVERMVRYDFRRRYHSTAEVLQDLSVIAAATTTVPLPVLEELPPVPLDDSDTAIAASTQPWPETFGSDATTSPTEHAP